jgi:hypothetical protein
MNELQNLAILLEVQQSFMTPGIFNFFYIDICLFCL